MAAADPEPFSFHRSDPQRLTGNPENPISTIRRFLPIYEYMLSVVHIAGQQKASNNQHRHARITPAVHTNDTGHIRARSDRKTLTQTPTPHSVNYDIGPNDTGYHTVNVTDTGVDIMTDVI